MPVRGCDVNTSPFSPPLMPNVDAGTRPCMSTTRSNLPRLPPSNSLKKSPGVSPLASDSARRADRFMPVSCNSRGSSSEASFIACAGMADEPSVRTGPAPLAAACWMSAAVSSVIRSTAVWKSDSTTSALSMRRMLSVS